MTTGFLFEQQVDRVWLSCDGGRRTRIHYLCMIQKVLTVFVTQALLLHVGRQKVPALVLQHLPIANEHHQAFWSVQR